MNKNALLLGVVASVLVACAARDASPPRPQPPLTRAQPEPAQTPGDRPVMANATVADPSPAPEQRHFPFQDPLTPADTKLLPATRFARLTPGQCRNELRKRKLTTRRPRRPAPGVATPLRLSGPLRGVEFLAPGQKSTYGTLDCRLVLALEELAAVLERHAVTKVHVDNFYRPRAHLPGRRKRSQHAHGLAVDVRALELADGRLLTVERDWSGAVGSAACGPESSLAGNDDQAVTLRNIICDVVRQGVFHHVLTPSYDAAHRDHVHLDIKRDARGTVVR